MINNGHERVHKILLHGLKKFLLRFGKTADAPTCQKAAAWIPLNLSPCASYSRSKSPALCAFFRWAVSSGASGIRRDEAVDGAATDIDARVSRHGACE
eukprot:6210618-Pleurochrysis_carterae.AAC.10